MKTKIKYKMLLLLACICLASCKINQTRNGLEEGKWIKNKSYHTTVFTETGKYKKGIKRGSWKNHMNNKLLSKIKYKKNTCYVIEYHNTGKIRARGFSNKEIVGSKTEWLPTGKWEFYDSEGLLLGTKIYKKGIPIEEIYTQ
ncbi:hypothetical protein [Flavobacterium hiemivividum]|uniref:Toxin-antitoxin system YwqK family antitoxin n=1 Tax=Flavobacterium hiemivividum TaxID=2541734 RepID=A0A4R5CUP4_9FLAO|nr:hypothetical protein [Flavobacterium hiemivividum]TDE01565.1 hypothetical protein E0F98_14560 [Flavobacterium hiemivividum]